jgi:hypothetical protein
MVWIGFIWLRIETSALVNTVLNLRLSYNARKLLSSCTIGSFSKGLSSMSECVIEWSLTSAYLYVFLAS